MVHLPDLVTVFYYGMSVEEQYIVKNRGIIGAALVVGGIVFDEEQTALHPTGRASKVLKKSTLSIRFVN